MMVKELSLNFGKSKARRDVRWRHITAVGVPLVVVASLAIGVQCAINVDTEHTFVGKTNGGGTGVCNNFNPNGNNNGHRGAEEMEKAGMTTIPIIITINIRE